ncbi:alpha/beta hydrolase [Nonomuraea antimicrobica]
MTCVTGCGRSSKQPPYARYIGVLGHDRRLRGLAHPPARAPHESSIKGLPPVLVVGNTHDPATPLRWARSLSARIQGSGLLTNDSDGHTAYRRSACATRHIDAYLVTGKLPATGTVCKNEIS